MTVDRRAIHLYNDYIHGSMARRDFLARLIGIAGSAAAATALLSVLEPNHAHARQVAEHDPRVHAERVRYPGVDGPVNAYLARPATPSGPLPAVLVIHENRGLNPHIEADWPWPVIWLWRPTDSVSPAVRRPIRSRRVTCSPPPIVPASMPMSWPASPS